MKPAIPQDAQIFVRHIRLYDVGGHIEAWSKGEAKKVGLSLPPLGRGGMTTVQVELADGRTARGSAHCNPLDNFNKARGRMIATGRALKRLEAIG